MGAQGEGWPELDSAEWVRVLAGSLLDGRLLLSREQCGVISIGAGGDGAADAE